MSSISGVKVNITYCNGVEFSHQHDEVRSACREYANLLAEAVEPTGKLKEDLHIKELSLVTYDDEGWESHAVGSGQFLCSHSIEPVPA